MIEEPPGPTDRNEIIEDYRHTWKDSLLMWPTLLIDVPWLLFTGFLWWLYCTFTDGSEDDAIRRNLEG